MRALLAFVVVTACCSIALAKEPHEYPLTITVISSESSTSSHTATTDMDTYCTTDSFGHTDCSTTGGTRTRTVTSTVQTAEGSDGNLYTLQCTPGFGRAIASGAGEAMTQNAVRGCQLMPGEYKGRFDKRGLKLLVHDSKGKLHEWTFQILSVRKKETTN